MNFGAICRLFLFMIKHIIAFTPFRSCGLLCITPGSQGAFSGMLRFWCVVFLLTAGLLIAAHAFASEQMPADSPVNPAPQANGNQAEEITINRDYLKGYFSDTGSILSSPARWTMGHWTKVSLIAGTTAGLYIYDHEIRDWSQRKRSNTSDSISRYAKHFGDISYAIPVLGIFSLYGHVFEKKQLENTALLCLEAVVISGMFTEVVKRSTHRHRPLGRGKYDEWDGPGLSSAHSSFPSGHASSAFAIAAVLSSEFRDNAYIPPAVYGAAALAAVSRINDNYHWSSDVFAGAAIGYFTGKAIAGRKQHKAGKYSLLPATDGRRFILMVAF
jgi:membrane-associated phospholipid phosphatase